MSYFFLALLVAFVAAGARHFLKKRAINQAYEEMRKLYGAEWK